jgi:hypothetical protein
VIIENLVCISYTVRVYICVFILFGLKVFMLIAVA